MKIKLFILIGLIAAPLLALSSDEIEEIIVTADFRDVSILEAASSISVIDANSIAHRQARHLEQVLNLIPNVNYSSGASRGRFIQIRGIGERSQFIEPMNPSVGILIDGIDFSGIGGAATTMDLKQIEILRGPQGTLFGANALAGMINLKSNAPTLEHTSSLEASMGADGLQTFGGVISGPLNDRLGYRLAVQEHRSDGFIRNDFLGKDDTDDIDELTLRGKLDAQINDDWTVDLTVVYVDADNGYDAFSLDNTRHTLSDQPGHDRQESTAVSINSTWQTNDQFDVVAMASFADSDLEYGYDEDWSYVGLCNGTDCDFASWGFDWEYSSFDNYMRDRENATFDLRLVSQEGGRLFNDSTAWVLGAYFRDQDVSLLRQYTFAAGDFTSSFDTRNIAVYGQLDTDLSDRLSISAGLRFERREADYDDSDGIRHDTDEDLWGGRLALIATLSDNSLIYGLISRGYKAGGVNSDPGLASRAREFDTEDMWNLEAGIKGEWLDSSLKAQIAVFYQIRDDVQVKQSLVEPIAGTDCPCSFTDFFDNAAEGSNYGVELELNWQSSDRLSLYANVGLLESEFKDYLSFTHVNADPANAVAVDLDGHDQAHAPSYQFAIGGQFQLFENLTYTLDVEGKDEFDLSPRHEATTDSYELVHTSLRYETDQWEITVWGRNLNDEEVIVRGFGSFGNDPRKLYATEPYYQYGAPRTYGVTTKFSF